MEKMHKDKGIWFLFLLMSIILLTIPTGYAPAGKDSSSLAIVKINNISMEVSCGDKITLPKTVAAVIKDGQIAFVPVTWNSQYVNTAKPGTSILLGAVTGYGKYVQLEIHVNAVILSIDDLQYSINQHKSLQLPSTVYAHMGDGSLKSVFITWDKGIVDSEIVGQTSYYGKVKGFDSTVKATVTVKAIIENVQDQNLTVSQNGKVTCPSGIIVKMSDGKSKSVPVAWDGGVDTSKVGTFILRGKIKDYAKPVKLVVKVLPNIASVEDITATINTKDKFELPELVTAHYSDLLDRSIQVKWSPDRLDTSKSGNYEFFGTIPGYGKQIHLNVSIIDTIAGIDDISATVNYKGTFDFPETIKATANDGETWNVPVVWNQKKIDTTVIGTKEILGDVVGYSKNVKLIVEVKRIPVQFADPNLMATVCAAIGRNSTELYLDQVEKLNSLNAAGKGITNLAGIECLTGLKTLNLGMDPLREIDSQNFISDLTPLSGLTGLTSLTLSGNGITDLEPLSKLTNLTELNLVNNQIKQLDPLSGLVNLSLLRLGSNQIEDLSPLSGMNHLTQLTAENNGISSLQPIANLTEIHGLYVNNNRISDISPILGMKNMMALYLGSNQIKDISKLDQLPSLVELDLSKNNISDISSISNLNYLVFLSLFYNQVNDINSLKNKNKLRRLYLGMNPITNYSATDSYYSLLTDKDF